MTAADQSAQVPSVHDDHASIEARLAELERERQEMRDHRTQVRTLLSLAGAAAVAVILGAVTVRDTTLATAARLAPLEARAAALEAAAGHRNAANGGAPTALYGAGFNDSGSATEVYYGGMMGGANAGERSAAIQNPPTATDVWVRMVIRPGEPVLSIATGLGVASARPTTWYPTATSAGILPPFATAGGYSVADTSVATAIAVWAQSFGGGGTSSITAGLTIRVTR